LTRRQVVGWRNAVFLIFALSGVSLASWVARTPSIRDTLGASTFQMGLLVFGLALGSIVGLTTSSHVLARIGSAPTIRVSLLAVAVGLVVIGIGATAASFAVVAIGLAVFGLGNGTCDVAMNVEGAANERALDRTVMPLFHALFSGGTILGAALGAAAEFAGLSILAHMVIIAALIAAGGLFAVRFLQPDPAVAAAEQAVTDKAAEEGTSGWRSRLGIWRDHRTLLIGLIVLGMAFAEGSANDWLALAMVDGHGVANATGALIFGIFVTAMTVGRVGGVWALDRFGRVPVLRVSAVLAAVGLTTVIFAPAAWLAVIGVVLWGLGSALGFPVGMSAAADDPVNAAARVSAVATIGYLAFLVGPPVLGFVGEHVGLLNALLLVLVLVAVAGIVSPAARKPERTPVG
jgi:fucose permease